MALHMFVFLLVVCLLLSLTLLWCLDWLHLRPSSPRGGAKRSTLHRLRHRPAAQTIAPPVVSAPLPRWVGGQHLRKSRPWPEVKSRRGAPKRVNTEGYACPNQQCPYFGITEAHIHALVGDGKHGRAERIQTFRGPACHTTFSARLNTPLYRLKTPSHHIAMVLSAAFRRVGSFRCRACVRLQTSHHHEPF